MSDERYVFLTEWYDTQASIIRQYNFIFYADDKTVEMYDLKNRRVFLKRSEYPGISLSDLFLGSIVTVHSRQLKIVDYADQFTKGRFEVSTGKTFAMIKPDAYTNIGKIISVVESQFSIGNVKMAKLTSQDAGEFYKEHQGKSFFEGLTNFITSDFVVGLELVANDAISKWRQTIGPTNSLKAKEEAPGSIRAAFGTDGQKNAVHGSDAPQSAMRETEFFFSQNSKLKSTALFNNCTVCIIKPHILKERKAGQIIDLILSEGFEISALQMFFLDRITAEEFFEVYKGVIPEFQQVSEHLTTGPCLALEIRQENAVKSFRELCGPHDPEIARVIRPNSLRAKFGQDRVKNAVHCTDLPEDGILEVEYFFNILQN